MVVALLMRLWILIMLQMGVDPKVLADDALLIARGRKMLRAFANALEKTHEFMQSMDAKVAPGNSFNFASTKQGKKWLRETVWTHIGGTLMWLMTSVIWVCTSAPR